MSTGIINYFVNNNIWIRRNDFEKINKLIAQQFPTECVGYYYSKVDENRTSPGGKIYHGYKNLMQRQRQAKLVDFKNQKRNSNENSSTSAPAMTLTETEENDVEFLRSNNEYSVVLEAKWKATSRTRLQEMKSCLELKDISSKYPAILNVECNQLLVRNIKNSNFSFKKNSISSPKLLIDFKTALNNASYKGMDQFEKFKEHFLDRAFKKSKHSNYDKKLLLNEGKLCSETKYYTDILSLQNSRIIALSWLFMKFFLQALSLLMKNWEIWKKISWQKDPSLERRLIRPRRKRRPLKSQV